MMNSAEYPTLVQATATGWKITAFKENKHGGLDSFACHGEDYNETLKAARAGLSCFRAEKRLWEECGVRWENIEIIPTNGVDDINQ